MSQAQREEILQAEAAIRQLAEHIAHHAAGTQQAHAALEGLQQALRELGESKKDISQLATKTERALRKRIDELVARSESVSQRLEDGAGREEQAVAQLQGVVEELQRAVETLQTSTPRMSTITEIIDSALAAQLEAVDDARTWLLTDIAALASRLDQRERHDQAFRASTEARLEAVNKLLKRIRSAQTTAVILLTAGLVLNVALTGGIIYLLLRG